MSLIIARLCVLAVATGAGVALAPALGIKWATHWLGLAGFLCGVLAVVLEWQGRGGWGGGGAGVGGRGGGGRRGGGGGGGRVRGRRGGARGGRAAHAGPQG